MLQEIHIFYWFPKGFPINFLDIPGKVSISDRCSDKGIDFLCFSQIFSDKEFAVKYSIPMQLCHVAPGSLHSWLFLLPSPVPPRAPAVSCRERLDDRRAALAAAFPQRRPSRTANARTARGVGKTLKIMWLGTERYILSDSTRGNYEDSRT